MLTMAGRQNTWNPVWDPQALSRHRKMLSVEIELLKAISADRGRGWRSFLVPASVRLLEAIIAIDEDMLESLELSFDPEVREQIAGELQQLADSRP